VDWGLRYRIYAIGITLKVQFIGLSLINTLLYANTYSENFVGPIILLNPETKITNEY